MMLALLQDKNFYAKLSIEVFLQMKSSTGKADKRWRIYYI